MYAPFMEWVSRARHADCVAALIRTPFRSILVPAPGNAGQWPVKCLWENHLEALGRGEALRAGRFMKRPVG